ncbi:hypothetical protein [Bifidobacterium biavatii]|uniref:Uncharacterized protein n=1 Tax=Bifidobacterium biavatii DSM 23969 TaxID=1437608 RepID=A0A086ZU48_9BIFI|nr:hypothetical protein [Bifidobacterium biavatii]KFI50048.1 hypothetical protein BBIA_2181 [Bifidobacterium biavatii DSM 23969]
MITAVYHQSCRPSDVKKNNRVDPVGLATGSAGGRHRYPYLTLLLILATALIWLLTHEGCAHPIGNTIAWLVACGYVPLRLLALIEAR